MPLTTGDVNSLSTWVITLNTPVDLSAVTVTFRMCIASAQAANSIVQPFVSNADASAGTYGYQKFDNSTQTQLSGDLTPCSTGLSNIVLDPVTAGTGGYDAKTVSSIGLTIGSEPGSTAPWSSPAVVRLDSITISGATGVGPYTFTTNTDPLLMGNPYATGTTFTWINN